MNPRISEGSVWIRDSPLQEVQVMRARATDGTRLATLVRMAIPLLRAAQRQCPRWGPGRPPQFDDGKMAVMIVTAILKNRKSKSAQYRFLREAAGGPRWNHKDRKANRIPPRLHGVDRDSAWGYSPHDGWLDQQPDPTHGRRLRMPVVASP
jgi:hypothetical protein